MLVCYFGELVGMVGSMETKAPSGSTIMMAVFLHCRKVRKVEKQ